MHKEVVWQGTHENQLYKLQCNTKSNMKEHAEIVNFGNSNIELNVEECVQVVSHGENNFHLWHEQLGHLNVKDIKLLAQYNLV